MSADGGKTEEVAAGAEAGGAKPVATVFNVGMTCQGCAKACTRILSKIDGVLTVVPDVEAKTVLVTGTAEPQVMLEALQKWGTASGKSVALA